MKKRISFFGLVLLFAYCVGVASYESGKRSGFDALNYARGRKEGMQELLDFLAEKNHIVAKNVLIHTRPNGSKWTNLLYGGNGGEFNIVHK